MMKTLRYFFVAALAMVGMNSLAQTEFNFDDANTLFNHPGSSSGSGASYVPDGEFTSDATATIGDFSVTVSASDAEATTKNRIWTTAPKLRMYNGTLTIKSTGSNIKSIVFTCGTTASNSKWSTDNTANVGQLTVEKPTITWTGDAKEVVINIAANTQFNKLVISTDGGVTPPPTPVVEEITVAKALEIIGALADGATTTEEYKVSGYVVGDPDFQRNAETGALYGNVNLTIADAAGGSPLLTVYRAKNIGNVNFTEETIGTIKAGYQVVFQGQLQKYVKDNLSTPELKNGFLVSVTAGGGETGLETVWDFTVLPTAKIDGAGNIETNATDGIFVEDEGAAWQQAYNKAELPDGTEFISNADGTVFEPTKHLVWSALSSNKMVFYRNYPPAYGGKHLFFNKEAEVMIPCKAGQVIEMMMTGSKVTTKKITSQDVVETFDEEGTPVGGVKLDITTAYGDYFPVTLTAKVENVYLTFQSTLCIQKITVKDGGTGIAAVKTANKVANNVMYNLAGQKVGKDYKGIVIVNGKKMLNK